MTDQVRSGLRKGVGGSRLPLVAVGGVLAAFVALLGLAAGPYLFNNSSLRSEIAEQVRSTTGLMLKTDGRVSFSLLPQPHVEMANLHFTDRSGTLNIEAEALRGEVRLLPLLVGRLEIASATLERPRLGIDLDAGTMPADNTIGHALHPERPSGARASQRLGIVTLVDGTAILKSKLRPRDTVLDAINVTLDWRSLDSPATITGALTFKGVSADVAAWVGQPSSLLRGEHSAIALRIQSAPLDLSANGDYASAPNGRFHGSVTVNAPRLKDALALTGFDAVLPAPFADMVLKSEATIGRGVVDLPNLRLRLDGNDFEGTLAYQDGGEKPILSGTLATEQFSLAPFLSQSPVLLKPDGRWSDHAFDPSDREPIDLDLRISATHLHMRRLAVDDAALAVMTRDERTEIALVEGTAYGGALKGRASIGMANGELSLRTTASLNDADASALSWDLFGRQLAAGSLSISANLEGTGDSTESLMQALHGSIKGRASDGELSGIDLDRGLQQLGVDRTKPVMPALYGGRTQFNSLLFSLQVSNGVATVETGVMTGINAKLAIEGATNIGARALRLQAIGSRPGSGKSGPTVHVNVEGTYDHPVVTTGYDALPAPPTPSP